MALWLELASIHGCVMACARLMVEFLDKDFHAPPILRRAGTYVPHHRRDSNASTLATFSSPQIVAISPRSSGSVAASA